MRSIGEGAVSLLLRNAVRSDISDIFLLESYQLVNEVLFQRVVSLCRYSDPPLTDWLLFSTCRRLHNFMFRYPYSS